MNVPSKSSYQSTCVTRTVQSIDKDKQKNAGVRRYNTVSGRVTASCCNAQPVVCNPPTTGDITPSNCSSDGQYITTCDYTVNSSGGTLFQWFYESPLGSPRVALVDGPIVSGSQTQTLRIGANSEPEACPSVKVYCIVTNNCGSTQSTNAQIVGGCVVLPTNTTRCNNPTAGNITSSNFSYANYQLYTITTGDYTVNSSGGTSFQWYYETPRERTRRPIVDNSAISGSQTPTIRLSANSFDNCEQTFPIYCIVTNSCGSSQSTDAQIVGGCVILCPKPSVGDITSSNCSYVAQTDTTTCDYTVDSSDGTSFQWFYYLDFSSPQEFVDGPNVSGSQTQTITLSASPNGNCVPFSFFCNVTNSCGTTRSPESELVGGCPILD